MNTPLFFYRRLGFLPFTIALVNLLCMAFAEQEQDRSSGALQKKINLLPPEGGIIQLEHGTYLMDRPLLLRSGVRLRGAGPGTVLLAKPGARFPILAPAPVNNGLHHVEVSSLVLDGNSKQQTFSDNNASQRIAATAYQQIDNLGLYLKRSHSVAVSNVLFRNFLNEATMAIDCSNLCYVACVFSNCCQAISPTNDFAQAALYLRHTTDSLILSNRLIRCEEGGICLGFKSHRNKVIGNESDDSQSGEGISIGCGNENLILGNIIRRSSHGGKGSGAGIAVWACVGPKTVNPALRNLIVSNSVEHTGGSGIAVLKADGTVVRQNSVEYANENRNANQGGISVFESDHVVIEENRVRNTAAGSAIIMRKSHDGAVRGNRFFNNPSPYHQQSCLSLEFTDNR